MRLLHAGLRRVDVRGATTAHDLPTTLARRSRPALRQPLSLHGLSADPRRDARRARRAAATQPRRSVPRALSKKPHATLGAASTTRPRRARSSGRRRSTELLALHAAHPRGASSSPARPRSASTSTRSTSASRPDLDRRRRRARARSTDGRRAGGSAAPRRSPRSRRPSRRRVPGDRQDAARLRLAADPQPRDARRQPRHRVADRRHGARPARARRRGRPSASAGERTVVRSTTSSPGTARRRSRPTRSSLAIVIPRTSEARRRHRGAAVGLRTRSPSGASSTSASSPRRSSSTSTPPASCATRGSRTAASPRRRCARGRPKRSSSGRSIAETVDACAAILAPEFTPIDDVRARRRVPARPGRRACSRSSVAARRARRWTAPLDFEHGPTLR